MYLPHKGQTSLEFIIIILVVVLLAITITSFFTSTFDINIAIYKTKNKTMDFISQTNQPYIINGVYYNSTDSDLNLIVVLKKGDFSLGCPVNPTDYNYTNLQNDIVNRTKFNNVDVILQCTT